MSTIQTNFNKTKDSIFSQPWIPRATCAVVVFGIVSTVLKTHKLTEEQTSYLWGAVCAIGTYVLSKSFYGLPFSFTSEKKEKTRIQTITNCASDTSTRNQEIGDDKTVEILPVFEETFSSSSHAAMSDAQIIENLQLNPMDFHGKARKAICENFRSKSPILDLSNCDIRQIPEGLKKFTWLQHINLQDNYCLGNLAHLETLPYLQSVNVWGTAIARHRTAAPLAHVKIISTELEAIHQMLQDLTHALSLQKIDISSFPLEDHHKLLTWLKKITNRDTGWMGMYRFAPWESDPSKVAATVLTLLKNAQEDNAFYRKHFRPFIEKSIASHALGNDCVYFFNEIMDQWTLHNIDALSKKEMQRVLDHMFRKDVAKKLGTEADPEKNHTIFASPSKYQHTFCRELGIPLTFSETSSLPGSVSAAEREAFQKLIADKSLRDEFYISLFQQQECLQKLAQERLDQIDQAKTSKLKEMAELEDEIPPQDYVKALQDVKTGFEKLKREALLESIASFTD